MTAQDYKVEFGYGAQDGKYYGPNGSVGKFHRGNDRYCAMRTPVYIDDTLCGFTGKTGLVGGPHLHTQAGTDPGCQNTFDPTPLDFKPGIVIAVSNTDKGQWGKYFTLQVGDKYITYAHMDEVVVTKGQVIGEDMAQPADYPTANIYTQTLLFRDMSEEEFNKFHRGKTRDQLFDSFRNAPERYQNIKRMIESDNKDLDENSKKLKEALKDFLQ